MKMTKTAMFQQLEGIVENAKIDPTLKTYLLEQLEAEIDMIARRNMSRRNAANKKRAEENEPIKKAILNVLEKSVTCKRASAIRESSPELMLLSSAKVSAVLKQMAENREIYREIEGSGKKGFYIYAMHKPEI